MNTEIKILIAEDHEWYRQQLVEDLMEFNIKTVGQASTGLELIDLVRIKSFDVIILDLRMPDMEGDEAFDILMKEFPHLKIIIMSMYDEACIMEDFMFRGAFGFVPKNPPDLEKLGEIIREVHNSKKCFYYYDPKLEQFGKREQEVIPLLCDGKTNKEIGKALNISRKAVETNRNALYKKTKSKNLASFIKYATIKGLDFLKKKKE